ncbi:helix-turn-helix transcriptional regulator [Streptomyces sp. DSM 40907]|uniref:helix-turn-helix transcriptional regulator n=1 Tax=Streptomyces kutzneri TaxID=3051179 RepID=UPI0028D06EB1|nr:LuxR C-terminal-related transcriptional regulator [Streptomyces sp. DSM 40907]
MTKLPELCEAGLKRYRDVLAAGGATADRIPDCLVDLGLLRFLPDNPGSLTPVPPDLAAASLSRPIKRAITEHQDTLMAIRTTMARAEAVYAEAQQDAGGTSVQVLSGESVIAAALEEAVQSCREELLTAQPNGGRSPELLAEALPRDLALAARGVKQRTLYQHTVRAHGPTLSYIERVVSAGAEVRTIDEVFERLIVCDSRTAFMPGPHDRRQSALVIRHPSIIEYLVKGFEQAWSRAAAVGEVPSRLRPPPLTNETRRAVLRLMVEGYTDEAIAGRLGISRRTVGTHVQKTSEVLGSRSRAQLAYLIAQTDLLDHSDLGAVEEASAETAT